MGNFKSVTSDEGATFEPWTDGHAVGFKVTAPGKRDMYVYLNPSAATDTGELEDSDVFVYLGDTGDADLDEPQCYVNVWPSDFQTAEQKSLAEEARQDAEFEARKSRER